MSTASPTGDRLRRYLDEVGAAIDRSPTDRAIVREVSRATKELCRDGGWLEARFRVGARDRYERHLLHRDPRGRFVVLALVWQPGQVTPIHDHGCWGVMGLVENSLEEHCYERLDDGARPERCRLRQTRGGDVGEGGVSYLLPPYEEIHWIGNTSDRETISLHVYGRDIDQVQVFDADAGTVRTMRVRYDGPGRDGEPLVN